MFGDGVIERGCEMTKAKSDLPKIIETGNEIYFGTDEQLIKKAYEQGKKDGIKEESNRHSGVRREWYKRGHDDGDKTGTKRTLSEVLKDITIDGNNYKRAGWGELWDCIRETRDKLEQKLQEMKKGGRTWK